MPSTIYTFTKTKLTTHDVAAFNSQYPKPEVKHTNIFHDRFLILDGKTVYHIGAPLKDAGKKCFAVSLLKDAGSELMKKIRKKKIIKTEIDIIYDEFEGYIIIKN